MANPQPEQFTRLSNELYEAIMQTDFSKRQRNILDLVIRMSYGCGKKQAILRKTDFQQVGVGKNHIKGELEHLQASKVLLIDGDIIQLNKNYDEWRVNLVKGFNKEKFNKILKRNLTGETVPETGTMVPKTGTKKVPETGTTQSDRFPKQEPGSSQNRNHEVPKTGTDTASKPSDTKGFELPKDILKKSKDIKIDRTIDDWLPKDELADDPDLKDITTHYIMTRESGTILNNIEQATLSRLLYEDKIPPADIKEGITVAFSTFKPKHRRDRPGIAYCETVVLDRYARKQGRRQKPPSRNWRNGSGDKPTPDLSAVEQREQNRKESKPVDPETEARLRAKLKRMRERLSQRAEGGG